MRRDQVDEACVAENVALGPPLINLILTHLEHVQRVTLIYPLAYSPESFTVALSYFTGVGHASWLIIFKPVWPSGKKSLGQVAS